MSIDPTDQQKHKWFVLKNEQVLGPLSAEEIEKDFLHLENIFIWGKNFPEWINISKWKNKFHQLQKEKLEKPIEESEWKLRVEGKESSLMKFDEMIDYLKSMKDLNNIEVCNERSKKWKDLFAVPQIIDELGVTRRAHPRVPIIGSLHCESHAKGTFDIKVIAISEGGMGVVEAKNLRIGDRFKGTLDSPNLFSKVVSQCEVLYVGKDGYVGLKFVGLPLEFKTQLIEYVNKFSNE